MIALAAKVTAENYPVRIYSVVPNRLPATIPRRTEEKIRRGALGLCVWGGVEAGCSAATSLRLLTAYLLVSIAWKAIVQERAQSPAIC